MSGLAKVRVSSFSMCALSVAQTTRAAAAAAALGNVFLVENHHIMKVKSNHFCLCYNTIG